MIARKSFLEVTSKHITRLNTKDRRHSLIDEKKFELVFLRNQFKKLDLEPLYESYMQRLRINYLKVFILIDLIMVGVYIAGSLSMFFCGNTESLNGNAVLYNIYLGSNIFDVISYVISALLVWGILALNFIEDLKRFSWLNVVTSSAAVIILALVDAGNAIYFAIQNSAYLITSAGAFILYAIYIFVPFRKNIEAFVLGMFTTALYLASYVFTTAYILHDGSFRVEKLLTEAIFLLTANFLGLSLRILKEINIRITMLDRYKFVEENLLLRYAKEEERRLLLSVIPGHIVNKIEQHVKSRLTHVISKRRTTAWVEERESQGRRSPELEKLFIEPHEDVSILYADVVNFTYLTNTLDVKKLVECLHDLFLKFDAASKEYNVLRIKFLGDCYYAVGGVDPPNPDHAKSCVDLGLRMINIIRDVSKKRELNIDMRIGVHTGSVISGVIGASKLQYDIWSKDVDIANRLEQTGIPGRVHISEDTLDRLKGEYMYEEGSPRAKADPLLNKFNINTFLIEPPPLSSDDEDDRTPTDSTEKSTSSESLSHFMQHKQQLIELRKQAKQDMLAELLKMPVAVVRLIPTKHVEQEELEEKRFRQSISPLLLYYRDWNWETQYLREPDDMLKYSVVMGIVSYFAIMSIQGINKMQSPRFWALNIIFTVLMVICLFLTWFKKVWVMFCAETNQSVPTNQFASFFYSTSKRMQSSITARMTIYLLIISIQILAIFIQLIDCHKLPTRVRSLKCESTFDTWGITESIKLTIMTMFLFSRIPFVVKLAMGVLITAAYSFIIFVKYSAVYNDSPSTYAGLNPKYSHLLCIITTFLVFCFMDRQKEFIWMMDFNLRLQLINKQEKAEITNASLKLLINNILPSHVADYYIANPFIKELYYEEYDNVAVMFATIKQYDIDNVGLRLLNEMICGFDEVLKHFEIEGMFKVEKIKLAGWTYMAACGLNIARSQNFTAPITSGMFDALKSDNFKLQLSKPHTSSGGAGSPKRHSITFSRPGYVAYIMAQFALELMRTLKLFRAENPQWQHGDPSYDLLRIGISNGPTMAGVIGASKPIYDIWGNCVNMASRMDSTGIPGHIQVTENTAEALRSYNIQCNFRDMTFVKGCGKIPTYFVGIDDDLNFIPHQIKAPKVQF